MAQWAALWPSLAILSAVAGEPLDVGSGTPVLQSGPGRVAMLPALPDDGRWSHAAAWDGGHGVFVFGGNVAGRPEAFNKSNALMHLDLSDAAWTVASVDGDVI